MTEKTHVALMVCPICMEDTGIALDRRLRQVFEYGKKFLDNSVCPECEQKYLKEGVLLINSSNGNMIVIKESALPNFFTGKIPKNRIIETPDKVLEKIREVYANLESGEKEED